MAQAKEVFGLQDSECYCTLSWACRQSAHQRTLIAHLDNNMFTASDVIKRAAVTICNTGYVNGFGI